MTSHVMTVRQAHLGPRWRKGTDALQVAATDIGSGATVRCAGHSQERVKCTHCTRWVSRAMASGTLAVTTASTGESTRGGSNGL